jgi:hypothetical protein
MSSHVGTVLVGGFSFEKEATVEELGGQPHEASQFLTLLFLQGKPRCI